MRVAILGVGRIGQAHAATVATIPAVREILIGDTDASRAEATAATVGGTALDLDAVFSARPDGVVITTPTATHAGLIERALAANIPVFCEKPVASTVAVTEAICALAAAARVPVQIGYQRRFDPGYVAAREALASGALGELRRAHLITCDQRPPAPDYIAGSGGIFRDCSIHDFDILRWVTGREVVSVFATGAARGYPAFAEAGDVSEAAAVLTLDDGTLATLQASRYNGAGYDVRMEVAGTHGQRTVGLDVHAALRSAEPDVAWPTDVPWATFPERFAVAYRAELTHFITTTIPTGTSPCTPDECLADLLVAEAAQRSLDTGTHVPVTLTHRAP